MSTLTALADPAPGDLDCALSVNTILAQFPATAGVFNAFGIDLCCGASLSVKDAARAHRIEESALCAALRDAIA